MCVIMAVRNTISQFLCSRTTSGCQPRTQSHSHLSIEHWPDLPFGSIPAGQFPYHSLGFSLVGFTAFHPFVTERSRLCGTLGLIRSCEQDRFTAVNGSLRCPCLHKAQSLQASQLGRVWTFLNMWHAHTATMRIPYHIYAVSEVEKRWRRKRDSNPRGLAP